MKISYGTGSFSSSNQIKRTRSSDSIEKLAASTDDNKELLKPTTQPSAADNSTNSILQNVGNTVHWLLVNPNLLWVLLAPKLNATIWSRQAGRQNAGEAIPQGILDFIGSLDCSDSIPTLGSISLLNNGFKYNGSGPIDAARICSLCDAYNAFHSPGSKTFFMFLDSIKECYEALVIAKFLALMYSYLKISISKNIVPDEIKGREIHHSFPMTLFQPHTVRLNHHTLKLLKYWTWQFVIIRPVCSVLMIALQALGLYPSWLSWTFTIILNVSVSLALYSLVVFYHVFAKELAPHSPLAKFLCIKGIVFFCFWQGVVIDVLAAVGVIRSHHFWLDVEHIEEAIQNVLICLEMVVFSVLQQYAYHVAPYSGDVESKMKLNKKRE
ncbi:transmembrane protein 184C [Prunus yedoensis var. nudiflora]|uniref:Transmembrane protein 184C n=1 Tax=Prunus yedoensis var. nudiflora TaxID=2094558 RepID=A0A314YI16_PRUYE|nr:transmembrane protein 184C [Prunus yedoensis var. nudiflora]